MTSAMVEPDPATPASTRRSSVLRGLLLLICVGVAAWALIGHWSDFRVDLAQLGWAHALLSVPPMLLGLVSGMLAWRAILSSLGSPIPAAAAVRIYFIGQLGKYVPGSMWPVVAQMELGRDFQIPRRRSVVALTMAIVTSLATGAISACIAIPFLPSRYRGELWWLLLAIPVCLLVMYPPVLMACLRRVPRLKLVDGIDPPPRAAMARAASWAFAGWLCFGLHVAALAIVFDPHRFGVLVVLSIGGYALAWCAGLIAFVLPAGAGARDVVLGASLAVTIPASSAIVVVVVSRVITTLSDLSCALVALGVGRRSRRAGPVVPTVAAVPDRR